MIYFYLIFLVKDWVRFTLSGSIFLIPIISKKSFPRTEYASWYGVTPGNDFLYNELMFEKMSLTFSCVKWFNHLYCEIIFGKSKIYSFDFIVAFTYSTNIFS